MNRSDNNIRGASGTVECNEIGELNKGLRDFPLSSQPYYLNKKKTSNLLSLALISDEYRVFMDTAINNAFYVFDEEGKYLRFGRCPISNLYRLDIHLEENAKVVLSVITVEGRMKEFSKLECARAKAARNLQHVLMCPSDLDLAHAIKHNIIGNNEYRREDIVNANRIFGKSEAMLKEK